MGPEAMMAWCRGRAYSQDLRDRVLAAVADGLSARDVAEQFQVSPSYVIKAWQRLNRTGERSARPQRSHTPRKLSEEQHAAIGARVQAVPDATVAELRAWVFREQGVSISLASMWTTLARLGLTLKKSAARGRTTTSGRGGGSRQLGQAAARA
jgi:transposase